MTNSMEGGSGDCGGDCVEDTPIPYLSFTLESENMKEKFPPCCSEEFDSSHTTIGSAELRPEGCDVV